MDAAGGRASRAHGAQPSCRLVIAPREARILSKAVAVDDLPILVVPSIEEDRLN